MFDYIRKALSPAAPPALEDALWARVCAGMPWLGGLSDAQLARLREQSAGFIASKEWHGAAELTLTDDMVLSIAIQACLPVLHLSPDLYGDFVGVVVYPEGFLIPKVEVDEDGVEHHYIDEAVGEAWPGGPIILSWSDAASPDRATGFNVVIHEFAHKLDMSDGIDDGIPVFDARFHKHLKRSEFERVMLLAYDTFCDAVDALPEDWDEPTVWGLDPYAATHPAEFFAVSVEAMFIAPEHLLENHPAWFDMLSAYLGYRLTDQAIA
jgi:hypothetical protein